MRLVRGTPASRGVQSRLSAGLTGETAYPTTSSSLAKIADLQTQPTTPVLLASSGRRWSKQADRAVAGVGHEDVAGGVHGQSPG